MTRGRPFIDGRPSKLIVLCPDVCGVGWDFRMGGVAENASRNLPLEWDAVSQRGHKRKPHPTPDGNSGTQFSEDYGLRTTWGRHKTPVKGGRK